MAGIASLLVALPTADALAGGFPKPPPGQGATIGAYHVILRGQHALGRAGVWLFPHPPGIGAGPEVCTVVRPVRGFRLRHRRTYSLFAIARDGRRLFRLVLVRTGNCVTGQRIRLKEIAADPHAYTLEIWPHGGGGRPVLRGRL
jgi:hypothetical protein